MVDKGILTKAIDQTEHTWYFMLKDIYKTMLYTKSKKLSNQIQVKTRSSYIASLTIQKMFIDDEIQIVEDQLYEVC